MTDRELLLNLLHDLCNCVNESDIAEVVEELRLKEWPCAKPVPDFDDLDDLQAKLEAQGFEGLNPWTEEDSRYSYEMSQLHGMGEDEDV